MTGLHIPGRWLTGRVGAPLLFGLIVLVVWQLVVGAAHVPAYIIPAPLKMLSAMNASSHLLLSAAGVSGGNALVGLVLGSVWALIVAVIAHQWRLLDGVFGALSAGASAVPIVAMAPLFYGMFTEVGEFPRQLTVAVLVFFPMYINIARGLKQVPAVHLDLMHTLAVSRLQAVRLVQLPAAAPFFFSGLAIAAPSAVIVSIVSEYFGGPQNGLGELITTAVSASSYDQAWGYVVAAVVLGLIAFVLTAVIEAVVSRRLRIDS